ncbi:MAG: ABC transporter permease [Gammaproteobacteria bacterium]|nr:ABC transporter permease [Gammaproteobacteria bacterium]
MTEAFASIESTPQGELLLLKGSWLVGDVSFVDQWIQKLIVDPLDIKSIDAQAITQMDTAGAYLLYTLKKKINSNIEIIGLKDNFHALLKLVSSTLSQTEKPRVPPAQHDFLYWVGKAAVDIYQQSNLMLAFLGEIFENFFQIMFSPVRLQWRSMIHEIDVGGYRGLPIIAVMMFLIGVVVAYQLGVQLRLYGADVYMVDLSGVSILREFSPLICSVIIAGRTSTSFAALLGTMKVNEEIDALRTMGMSPIDRLVIPKILGLLIALPLLVVWGDVFGLFGSMVMAKSMAGISFQAFLERFRQEVAIKHLYIGLVKTPVFALIIAGIGCFQGFQAEGSAQSVGERTTKAAVQAIFLIILADGLFSILFNWLDI